MTSGKRDLAFLKPLLFRGGAVRLRFAERALVAAGWGLSVKKLVCDKDRNFVSELKSVY